MPLPASKHKVDTSEGNQDTLAVLATAVQMLGGSLVLHPNEIVKLGLTHSVFIEYRQDPYMIVISVREHATGVAQ